MVAGPDFHVRQRDDGRLLAGGTFGAYEPRPGNTTWPMTRPASSPASTRCLTPSPLAVEGFTLGTRPIPKGGMPRIGRCPRPDGGVYGGLYVAHAFRLFQWCRCGDEAIDEILNGKEAVELAAFRMPAPPYAAQEGAA